MRIAERRNSITESIHDVSVAVYDGSRVICSVGDIDRPFYIRSAAKPFQAWVSQENGADLDPIRLAVAAASHHGFPAHVALVRSMLDERGLDLSDIRCPPSFPLDPFARDIMVRSGADRGTALWHNCSGKHSAMLRACQDRDWELATYTEPDHPLQRKVLAVLAESTDEQVDPMGIDGCGVPVAAVTVTGLARAYHRLGNDPVFSGVVEAMHRYPGLIRGVGALDDSVMRWWNAVAKGGAVGCLGVAFVNGVGIGVKCWDGSETAVAVALMDTLERVGLMIDTARAHLSGLIEPDVLGGGRPVGSWQVVA